MIVLKPGYQEGVDAQQIIAWCRENMAAYKCPRIVEFVAALPKSAAGKIMWRELQDREAAANTRLNPA
jgi:fatty-acyl-CoA synthase